MVQTLLFFFFIGLSALIFSKVEGVTYVDGIYITVVTTLTIGFGDLSPHTITMKIITFPFTLIGIGLLAVIVTSIVRLLSDRTRRRKLRLKKRLKEKTSEKERARRKSIFRSSQPPPMGTPLKRSLTLQEELRVLREDDWKRERRANIRNMVIGLSGFFIFWFFGALIFHYVEVHPPVFMLISHGNTETRSIFVTCSSPLTRNLIIVFS
jgi:potassium channel subfamily K, other eukaryote